MFRDAICAERGLYSERVQEVLVLKAAWLSQLGPKVIFSDRLASIP